MPRKKTPFPWPLRQSWPGHGDRTAYMRVVPYRVLNDDATRAVDAPSGPERLAQALSVNRSPGGLLLLMEGQPALHQRLKIRLRRDGTNDVVSDVVEVRWTRSIPALLQGDVHFVGVKFIRPSGTL